MSKKSWLQLILLLTLISVGIGVGIYERQKLKNCKIASKGVIYDIDRRKSRGNFVQYAYIVDEVEYKSSETIRTKNDLIRFNIGDSIAIYISCEDPSICKYK